MLCIADFKWSLRGVTVRETGVYIPFSLSLIKYIVIWKNYFRVESAIQPKLDFNKRSVVCHPKKVGTIYLLWGAMRHAGLEPASPSNDTKLHLYFNDQTYLDTQKNSPAGINRDCTDISKTRVAKVFEDVFDYGLNVDPRTATPPFICKSEFNGRHDGYVSHTNIEPQPGWVYQKLIQTETPDKTVLDLRCPTVFGGIPLIYLKERPIKKRFENMNSRVRLAKTEDYLSNKERKLITKFCKVMKLDWGGLDILRDANDGKIYIVDVNKTDMGPPLALPLKEKLASTRLLGQALRKAVDIHYPPAETSAPVNVPMIKQEMKDNNSFYVDPLCQTV